MRVIAMKEIVETLEDPEDAQDCEELGVEDLTKSTEMRAWPGLAWLVRLSSYKLFSDLLTDGRAPSRPEHSGLCVVAAETDRGGQEEPDVDGEEDQDWEVEVETQGAVLQETLAPPHCRSGHCRRDCSGGREVEGQQCESEDSSQAPASQGVTDEPQAGLVVPGNPGVGEGREEIKAHDRHPGEHGDGGKVAEVAESLAVAGGEVVSQVVDQAEVEADQQDGEDVAQHDLAVQVGQLRHLDVDQEGEEEEEAAGAGTDGVRQSHRLRVGAKTALLSLPLLLLPLLLCPVLTLTNLRFQY